VKLIFFTSTSGRSHVGVFLGGLEPDDQATVLAVFSDIEEHGTSALGCTFRQVEG